MLPGFSLFWIFQLLGKFVAQVALKAMIAFGAFLSSSTTAWTSFIFELISSSVSGITSFLSPSMDALSSSILDFNSCWATFSLSDGYGFDFPKILHAWTSLENDVASYSVQKMFSLTWTDERSRNIIDATMSRISSTIA